jgi:uncharacterized membrane protein YeaQ/YmgE (transglycosylase-associated protein family)
VVQDGTFIRNHSYNKEHTSKKEIMLMTIGALIVAALLLFIIYHGFPLFQLFIYLLILAVIGMIAGKLVRGRDYGLLGNIVLGFFGGIVGPILFAILGLERIIFLPYPIGYGIAGVVGSIVMIYLMREIDRRFAR